MSLFISTPCYGGMCVKEYAESMLKLRSMKFRYDIQVNESLITRARSLAVQRFADSTCEHMLFIDSDIQFPAEAVQRMIDTDADVVIVPYPKKVVCWEKALAAAKRGENPVPASASLALNRHSDGSVKDGATGFMMFKKSVIEKMQKYYPKLKVKNDHENKSCPHYWVLFDTMIDDGRYLSEDYAFCRRWQNMGGKVTLLDPIPKLGHVGNLTFAGQFNLAP